MAVTREPSTELANAFAQRFPRSLAEYRRALEERQQQSA